MFGLQRSMKDYIPYRNYGLFDLLLEEEEEEAEEELLYIMLLAGIVHLHPLLYTATDVAAAAPASYLQEGFFSLFGGDL